MAFFRRKNNLRLGRYTPPESFPVTPLETLVDEGVLIATSAIRLAVTNLAILRTLRDGEQFDLDWYLHAVREQLELLASEKYGDADRIAERISTAPYRGLREPQAYEPERLERRRLMSKKLAERLLALAGDDAWVEQLALASRDAALDELAHAVTAAALRSIPSTDVLTGAEHAIEIQDLKAELDGLRRID